MANRIDQVKDMTFPDVKIEAMPGTKKGLKRAAGGLGVEKRQRKPKEAKITGPVRCKSCSAVLNKPQLLKKKEADEARKLAMAAKRAEKKKVTTSSPEVSSDEAPILKLEPIDME
jgi:hypothetical protein